MKRAATEATVCLGFMALSVLAALLLVSAIFGDYRDE